MHQGKSAGEAFRDALLSIENKTVGLAGTSAIDALFGKSGGTGGGILGGGISSLLSGLIGHNAEGTGDWRGGPTWVGKLGPAIVDLPAQARVVPNATAMALAPPATQVFHFDIATPSPQAFAASQGQIAAVLARVAAQGARNG